ncbi:class I SAM-dependent methyltransferase [Kitasatospora cineracea]
MADFSHGVDMHTAASPWRRAEGARDFDLRYLDRDPRGTRRPYFESVLQLAAGHEKSKGHLRLLDVGCANGAFIHHAVTQHPNWHANGIDVIPELVDAAASSVPSAEFAIGNICNPDSLPAGQFDVVTVLTLASHFDTLDPWLAHVIELVAEGGMALVYGPLNPSPVDLVCRMRYAREGTEWLPGWNVLSQQTYDSFLQGRAKSWTYHYLPVADIGYPVEDPVDELSSRVVPARSGQRLGNSSGLTYEMSCIEIRV